MSFVWGGPLFLCNYGWGQDFQEGQSILLHQVAVMGC